MNRPAPHTFATKKDAEVWLVDTEAEIRADQYRALVLLAVFGSLRWGELAALRRGDLGLELCAVRVERSLSELPGGGFFYGPPKSAAGAGLWPSRTRGGHDLARELRGGDRLVPKPSEGGCCVAC